MAHPVVDGPITVLKVVTPGSYWVKCENCQGSCRIPESIRRKPYSENFYPPNGAKVFVHDTDGFFYHGTVCGRGEFPMFASMQSRRYAVQLTNTFQVRDFDRCHIYPTFDEESTACESAHLVSLYKVLPTFPPPEFASPRESKNLVSCQLFEDRIRNWDQSNDVVEDLIQRRRKFRYEQLSLINGSHYGKLSFFDGTGEINIKDFLASKKVVVRVSFRFETVVQSLMSRPLHKCFNLLPVYAPGVALVLKIIPETPINSSKEKVYYDLSKFRVYEEDISLHESLWSPTSTNILYTGLSKPESKEIAIRYVAPDGNIVLGYVLSPKVVSYELCERDRPPDEMLRKYIREQCYGGDPQYINNWAFNEMNEREEMPPSTDEEEDSISSHSEDLGLFSYDFQEALNKFRRQGGILEDYDSLSTHSADCRTVLKLVQMSFDNLNIRTLENWQLVCLPSMLLNRNVLIIGPESHRKLTTSIVSILSLMRGSSLDAVQNGVNPIFVLFVDNYKRAEQAARLCITLSDFKVIASTYSQITEAQKREAREGCDVLISTPGNWLKLTRDLKCFDCTRLAHVVFDSFEKLHKDYPSEIKTIFKYINSTNQVKAIILSNVWGPFLVDFVNLVGNTTRCVVDLVQACFCFRLEPTVVLVSDDWDEVLKSIIQNDRATLRLLLCHDHLEVTAIQSRMDHIDSVLFAHENEDRTYVEEIINQWKSNKKTFLVSSDALFKELDFVQNVNLLVSWKLNSCSRSTLIQRFMSIRGHANHERRKVPVYIFCDHNNLEELVFIKRVLENVKIPAFLAGDLNECISSAFIAREKLKMGNHCPSLYMFGKCGLTPVCPYRHHFRQQDLVHVVKNNIFLKITLVKFRSAFHSTVRVEDIISNQEESDTVIHNFASKLSEIERGLKLAFDSYMNGTPNLNAHMKVGDVVGACIPEDHANSLRRVKIISMGENMDCQVLLMDFDEPHTTILLKDLFPLPPRIGSYPRDIVEIFLSKLAPADFKSNWTFETKSLLNNCAELIAKNTKNYHHELLAGAVEVVIGQSIIVDSIHWCIVEDQCTYVTYGSVKEAVLASEYVKNNPEHFTLLSELAVNCGKQPFTDIVEEEFGFRRELPDGFNTAVVSAFDGPGLFYVQLTVENEKLNNLEANLTASLNSSRRKLSVVAEDELCCVEIDGVWNRALILGKDDSIINKNDSNTPVSILCVDYGDTRLAVCTHELFCLPDHFIKGVPYFAIECELVGILPFEGHWSDEVVLEFGKHIRNLDDQMTTVNVKFCGVVQENRCTKYFRHQVALQSLNDAELTINQQLVRRGMASWNQDTVDLLKPREKQPRRVTRLRKAV